MTTRQNEKPMDVQDVSSSVPYGSAWCMAMDDTSKPQEEGQTNPSADTTSPFISEKKMERFSQEGNDAADLATRLAQAAPKKQRSGAVSALTAQLNSGGGK